MNKPYLNLKGRVIMLFRDNEGALKFLAILSLASFGGLFFVSNTPLKNNIEVHLYMEINVLRKGVVPF